MKILWQWVKTNSIILINAGSLIGANMVTSALGFVYWWVAARRFPPESVGIASASISAMTLLGSFCIMGLGSLLITELPRQPGREGTLISTALIVVGGIGGCVGIVFAIIASYVSPSFKPLSANILDAVSFSVGVSLTAITLVLDQALIGLLLGKLQFWRNLLFALAKLLALFILGLLLSDSITIYVTWAVGNALSLMALAMLFVFKKGWPGRKYLPQWGVLRKLGRAAVQHHLLNLTLQLPTSVMPVLVTVLLSAKMNAWFYVSWTIVGFVFFVPVALTMVLHAMNSAQQSTLAHKARATISLSLIISALAICLLQFTAHWLLGIFGRSYAEQATWTLRILVLAAFPQVIKNHYISISRIYDRIKNAMMLIIPGSIIEILAAALGGHLSGLIGLSISWIIVIYIESIFMLPTIYKSVIKIEKSTLVAESLALWLVDTASLPAINPSCLEIQPFWLFDTIRLPIINQSSITVEAPPSLSPIMRSSNVGQDTRKLNNSKQPLQSRAHLVNNGNRHRLRPPRLQPYNPHMRYPNRLSTDNSSVDSLVVEKKCSNGTALEK